MIKFIFDLDGTITQVETLPLIAQHFAITAEICSLTKATVEGTVPFVDSFRKRVDILGKLPVDEIARLLESVKLYPKICEFINNNPSNCCIATGNLYNWIAELCRRLNCELYCSQGEIVNNRVVRLTDILQKETIVKKYQTAGYKVVFIGDGNNDVEAMRCADVAIAAGITHAPASRVLAVADYLITDEMTLYNKLTNLFEENN